MTIPTISLNGSTKAVLLQDICEAREKLHDAIAALRACSPHPRDYQLSIDGDYGRAQAEHRARKDKLCEVYTELEQLALQIDESAPDAR